MLLFLFRHKKLGGREFSSWLRPSDFDEGDARGGVLEGVHALREGRIDGCLGGEGHEAEGALLSKNESYRTRRRTALSSTFSTTPN